MTTAVLDTNVLVQALIGSSRSASARALDACYDGKFQLICSSDSLDELVAVLLLPHIRRRHGLSDDEVVEFIESLLPNARRYSGSVEVPASLTREPSDSKFLALAEESQADYLVTNDRRHLVHLGRYQQTRIVTPAQFLRALLGR
jgi:putative PIN family toxin of toxin-antitoxin system